MVVGFPCGIDTAAEYVQSQQRDREEVSGIVAEVPENRLALELFDTEAVRLGLFGNVAVVWCVFAEIVCFADHVREHPPNLLVESIEALILLLVDVFAVESIVDPGLRFHCLPQ